MANENIAAERLSFKEWAAHYDKEQESQRGQLGELTKIVHSLSADVKTLIDNQRGMFSRINRPQPVAAYVSALLASIAVMISFSALLVNPIKDDIAVIQRQDILIEKRLNEVEHTAAVGREAQRWNEKMTDRNNEQIDQLWYQVRGVAMNTCRLENKRGGGSAE